MPSVHVLIGPRPRGKLCRYDRPVSSPAETPRRTRMSRDARREQVLEIAQELFATQGYHHVSMDDIADQALVSKPVLYRHFPSKLDLYLAVVDRGGEALVSAVSMALEPVSGGAVEPGDGKAVVHALVRAYFGYVESAGQSASLLFESDVTRDDDVRARVESASAETARHISEVLEHYTGLPHEHNELVATALVGMAQIAASARHRGDGPYATMPVDEAAELVARVAWGGIKGLVRTEAPASND
ncbi:MAG: TetR/AcrR family transcriptional regulator [Actinomycetales bacterium]|nr:TetR/AcrR family transcriptional regulator [Actinomycetales bacterium]